MQATPSFAPEVYQLAKSAGLETPLTAFKPPKLSSLFDGGACGTLAACLVIEFLVADVLSVAIIFLLRLTYNVWDWLALVLAFMAVSVLAVWMLLRWRDHQLYAIYLCSDGLLWHHRRNSLSIHWDDVKAIWRKTSIVKEQRVITGYRVVNRYRIDYLIYSYHDLSARMSVRREMRT